jgi:hypothetical protein
VTVETRTDDQRLVPADASVAHGRLPYVMTTVTIVGVAAAAEFMMGRVPWCRCGYVKLWHGIVKSSENSQHLLDWYTFSHIVHGVGFYFLLWVFARHLPARVRFILAVVLEAAWEVLENTPFVINRYRAATIALDYYGDSIVNSMSDIAAMMAGFWIANKAAVWASVAVVALLEIMLAVLIRDNLTLNIIMLVYPLDAIRRWQLGG